METLAQVHIPALLVNSQVDLVVPLDCQQAIYDRLGSLQKEKVASDRIDHSMVMAPQRELVFETVQSFIGRAIDAA